MRRSLYSVLLGVVLAAAAIYLVYGTQQTTQEVIVQQVGPDMGIVLVATEDIPFGAALMEMHVRKMEWPIESIPDDIFQDQADLLESADGRRIAIRAISRGEPFLKSKVSGFGEKPTLSRKVAIDMRAFSIRINDVSGVAGFLLPGDRVDVLLTRTLTGGKNLITDIILQNVSILGIDQLTN
jgi:pilus assembly protein CpaB